MEDVKRDLQKGLDFVKEGAVAVKVKADELTEECRRQYKLYEHKKNVQKWVTELGGKIYQLSSKAENPLQNPSVQKIILRIKKLESQISKLEKQAKTPKVQEKFQSVKKSIRKSVKGTTKRMTKLKYYCLIQPKSSNNLTKR